jgi:hypothetical protein
MSNINAVNYFMPCHRSQRLAACMAHSCDTAVPNQMLITRLAVTQVAPSLFRTASNTMKVALRGVRAVLESKVVVVFHVAVLHD